MEGEIKMKQKKMGTGGTNAVMDLWVALNRCYFLTFWVTIDISVPLVHVVVNINKK
jgi:hypothetical protein